MFALTLLSAALLATQVTASVVTARSSFSSLLSRQSTTFDPSQIPPQCQSQCATSIQVLGGTSCTTISCLCTSTVNTGFQTCLNCVLNLGGPPDAEISAQAQAAVAQFEDQCAQAGAPLASLTVGATGSAAATPSGTGATSVVIPSNTNSVASSVFFSSSGAAAAPSSAVTATVANTATRSVITAPLNTGSSTAGAPSASNAAGANASSGASMSIVGLSGMAVAGVVGGVMMVLGL